MILNRFFYEGESGGEGGGVETIVETPVVVEVEKPAITLDQMKAWGFDSVEQVQNHFEELQKQNISEEEKRKQAELDNADFRKYAIGKDLMKESDFGTYETISQKQAVDLVFEEHLKEFKEDNPEITGEQELKDAAKADFNSTYKLDSENENVKKRGLAKIEKEAKGLKNPIESTFKNAKEAYESYKEISSKVPDFNKIVAAKITQHTPDKLAVYKVKDGENEIPVEIEITNRDREAMVKDFTKESTFQKFSTLPQDKFEEMLDKKMQAWLRINKSAEIDAKNVEVGIGIGKAKGSNVGAEAPFALVDKGSNSSAASSKSLDEQIRESHQQAAQKFR